MNKRDNSGAVLSIRVRAIDCSFSMPTLSVRKKASYVTRDRRMRECHNGRSMAQRDFPACRRTRASTKGLNGGPCSHRLSGQPYDFIVFLMTTNAKCPHGDPLKRVAALGRPWTKSQSD